MTGGVLASLFLVSLATVGFEIALTRYFAVAKWSEYGYWVISIVLAGFALSGVVMALARDWFARRGKLLLAWLPAALIAAAALGYHRATANPFNPLQLQNPATLWPQLWNIAGYYGCLLPLFFLAGLFVSLSFVLGAGRAGLVYGFDLTGAGAGALATLALMWMVHPFHLVACLLIPFALAALIAVRRRPVAAVAALAALFAGEALLLLDDRAAFNDYKAIYAPLHVPDSRALAQRNTPRGLYTLLDDFTERVDTDLSNNAALLGLPGPPPALGLYRDGNRIAALPRTAIPDTGYAPAALSALPYALLPRPRVLLVGASGGWRIAEARALGAGSTETLEPEPVLRGAIRDGIPGVAQPQTGAGPVRADGLLAALRGGARFDLIDIAGDFLDAAEANASAFTTEAIAAAIRATAPDGMVSIPVSIREFPAYATRMLATVRAALLAAGIVDPPGHVLVYRSAWNVRILASAAPFGAGRIAAARAWCDARSFDVSYYPGIDVAAARAGIYNDLPATEFDTGEVVAREGQSDAVADEAGPVLAGEPVPSARSFDLSPITLDRPSFYAVLRLSGLGTILKRLELLPQAEVGKLVNVAVLAQAMLIAALVLCVPLLGGRRMRPDGAGAVASVVYFAALGLGYLFIEIFAIDRASFYLNDRTAGFALVLAGMLVASGAGAFLADRIAAHRRAVVALATAGFALVWGAALLVWLMPAMLASLGWPWGVRAVLVLAAVAPAAVALGFPFPLGLAQVGAGGFLPWAWGLNGAFSVVATPLANLMALTQGYDRVLGAALVLYATAIICFPRPRIRSWQSIPAT